jgi:hypothetical protein
MVNQANTNEEIKNAKLKIALLKDKDGCSGFNELVKNIRESALDGIYTYEQIGVTEIELLELGLINARLKCVKGSSSIFKDQCVAQSYTRELVRLRLPTGGKNKHVA